MKKLFIGAALLLVLAGFSGTGAAYTADIAYYFQGLDVDTGALYTDHMTFLILPVDPVEQVLKPPVGILPSFDPAVDLFVEYNSTTSTDWLAFLPKKESDSSRIVGLWFRDEYLELDFSVGLARVEIPADMPNEEITFVTAAEQEYDVKLQSAWKPVPEPGTLMLLGIGVVVGSIFFRRRKHQRGSHISRVLLFVIMGCALFLTVNAPTIFAQTCVSPSASEGLAPTGTIDHATPTFRWTDIGESDYRLMIHNAASTEQYLNEWYSAEDPFFCGGGTCGVTPNLNLPAGEYRWQVGVMDPCVPGEEIRSTPTVFTVAPNPCISPAASEGIAPVGTISANTPTFTWTDTGESDYRLMIHNATATDQYLNQWYSAAAANCNGTSCSVTPPLNLAEGEYRWWVGVMDPCVPGREIWSVPIFYTVATMPTFAATYGMSETYEDARAIQPTNDGGYIVLALTPNPDGELTHYQNTDYWILKLDADGSVLWQKRYGRVESKDEPAFIYQTNNGHYIVAGRTLPFGTSDWDWWILELDNQGNVLWQKSYGEVNTYDYLYDFHPTPDGGYIAAGSSDTLWDTNGRDFWIVKFDLSGNILWQKSYHHGGHEQAHTIQVASDGGYLVSGQTNDGYIVVLKLDAFGELLWQKQYQLDATGIHTLHRTSDGGYALFIQLVTDTTTRTSEPLILKLDQQGEILWQKQYHADAVKLWGGSLFPTVDGGYVIGGTVSSADVEPAFWMLKLTVDGMVEWQNTHDSSWGRMLQQTPDGGYIAAGLKFTGNDDALVMKLDHEGNIPGCPIGTAPDIQVIETNFFAELSTDAISQNTAVSQHLTTVLPEETSAQVEYVCGQFFDYFMYEDPAHTGRFHDADKTGENDSNKCHAAASSNILDWGGWDLPPQYDSEQQIFGNFQTNWEDKGSLVKYISRWWIDGTTPPDFGDDWATVSGSGGGYFPASTDSYFAGAYLSYWQQDTLIETLKSYLHSGYGTTLSLYDSTDTLALGHVLSVWGYRYDHSGKVFGLWVTDSDDVSAEPPEVWLLPVEFSAGSGSEAKWRVAADSLQYSGWLLEGVEALKSRTETTPAEEIPRMAIVRKKCVDDAASTEIACPANDNLTIFIGDQVCDEECKHITVTFDNSTALLSSAKIIIEGTGTTFKGWEVNGEMWEPGKPYTLAGDIFLRPVIGRKHMDPD